MAILGAGNAIKSFAGALPFGIGYAAGTKIGYEGLGEMLFPSQRRNTYSSRYPTKFKLPYYRYRTSRYGRRYANRLWKNILTPDPNYVKPTNELGYPIKPPAGQNVWKYLSDNTAEQTLISCPLRWKRLKLITWSRGYVNTFKTQQSSRALS